MHITVKLQRKSLIKTSLFPDFFFFYMHLFLLSWQWSRYGIPFSLICTVTWFTGIEAKKEPTEEDDSVDRDLSTLFDFIPASMPMVSEWYNDSGEISNAKSGASDDDFGLEMQQLASEQDWSLNSCTWNNMPGICWIIWSQ